MKMYYNTGIDLRIMKTIYGYWRCSTDAQDQERQIRSLKDAGCEQIVGDHITGTSNYGDRKELSKNLVHNLKNLYLYYSTSSYIYFIH